MPVRVGINGFGRIGRLTFRSLIERGDAFDVALINDLADPQALANLFKYDTVYGTFPGAVAAEDPHLIVNGRPIRVANERDPARIPWKGAGVDVVLEATPAPSGRARGWRSTCKPARRRSF